VKCCLFSQANVIQVIDFFLLRVLHVNALIAAQKGDSGSLSEIKSLLEKLPSSNYQLLKYLCKFLVKVSMNEGTINILLSLLKFQACRDDPYMRIQVCHLLLDFHTVLQHVNPKNPTGKARNSRVTCMFKSALTCFPNCFHIDGYM